MNYCIRCDAHKIRQYGLMFDRNNDNYYTLKIREIFNFVRNPRCIVTVLFLCTVLVFQSSTRQFGMMNNRTTSYVDFNPSHRDDARVVMAEHTFCHPCGLNQYDSSQCLEPDMANCVGTESVEVGISSNMWMEDLQVNQDNVQSIVIEDSQRTHRLRWTRPSGLEMHVELYDIHLLPEFQDVDHPSSDNHMVLSAPQGTYAHTMREPLLHVIDNYCRHPLPSWYYLAMKIYRGRQTKAYAEQCTRNVENKACRNHEEKFYQRTVNEQCGRNLAAPLPEEPNAFYCTRNTPLLNQLFSETVSERIVDEADPSCAGYRRACLACIRQAERAAQSPRGFGQSGCTFNNVQESNSILDEDADETSQDSANLSNVGTQCCSLACYNIPACMAYHSTACHRPGAMNDNDNAFINGGTENRLSYRPGQNSVCVEGDTYKFSISPEFSFKNGTFQCHFRRVDRDKRYFRARYSVQLPDSHKHGMYTKRPPSRWTQTHLVHLPLTDAVRLESLQVRLFAEDHRSDASKTVNFNQSDTMATIRERENRRVPEDMILVGKLNHQSKDRRFTLYPLKSTRSGQSKEGSVELNPDAPRMERRLHGDTALLRVQPIQPHLYNTGNWKPHGCDVNISNLVSVKPFYHGSGRRVHIQPTIPVDNPPPSTIGVSSPMDSGGFEMKPRRFAVHDVQEAWPKLEFVLPAKQTTGPHKPGRLLLQRDRVRSVQTLAVQVELRPRRLDTSVATEEVNEGEQSWELVLSGQVTSTPSYLNIQIFRRVDSQCLFSHDYVVLSPDNSTKANSLKSDTNARHSFDPTPFTVRYRLRQQLLLPNPSAHIPFRPISPSSSSTRLPLFRLLGPLLRVQLTDCHRTRSFLVRGNSSELGESTKPGSKFLRSTMTNMATGAKHWLNDQQSLQQKPFDDDLERWSVYTPLIISASCVGLLYIIAVVIHTLVRSCSANQRRYLLRVANARSSINQSPHQILLQPQSLNAINEDYLYVGHALSLPDVFHASYPVGANSTPPNFQYYQPTVQLPHQRIRGSRTKHVRTRSRRAILFIYLAFRVFYTFLFTFSVAVSLIFSLQNPTSLSLDHMTSSRLLLLHRTNPVLSGHMNREKTNQWPPQSLNPSDRRLVGPILQLKAQARWLESFAEQEVRRQLDYVERMTTACQHAARVEITETVREMRQLVRDHVQRWERSDSHSDTDPSNPNTEYMDSVQTSINLIRSLVAQHRSVLTNYRDQLARQLDFRFTATYRAFQDLVERASKSGWLRYVERIINQTVVEQSHLDGFSRQNYRSHSPSSNGASSHTSQTSSFWSSGLHSHYARAQRASGLEESHVRMMLFMGFHQAETVHLMPLQLLHELERTFLINQYRPQVRLSNTSRSDSFKSDELSPNLDRNPSLHITSINQIVDRVFLSHSDSEYVDNTPVNRPERLNNDNIVQPTRRYKRESYSNLIRALSLTELRLVLLIIDCFIIVYRFYHTYRTLRTIWFGQRLHMDAATVLGPISSDPNTVGAFRTKSPARMKRPNGGGPVNSTHARPVAIGSYRDPVSANRRVSLQEWAMDQNRYECAHRNKISEMPIPETATVSRSNSPLVPATTDHRQTFDPTSTPERLSSPTQHLSVNSHPPDDIYDYDLPNGLLFPPPPSLGPSEPNVGCLVGIRTTWCRQSTAVSTVIGVTVVLVLCCLLLYQEQSMILASKRRAASIPPPSTSTANSHPDSSDADVTRGSRQSSPNPLLWARRHYDAMIVWQANRLNGEWLAWTQNNELTMRKRLLRYTARFRHDYSLFDKQMYAESESMMEALRALEVQKATSATSSYSKRPYGQQTSPNYSQILPPKLNSESLFRQQICHFLPVVPVRLRTLIQSMTSSPNVFQPNQRTRAISLQNLLWTAFISRAVDSDWSSLEQARRLTVTTLLVGLVMLGCVGLVEMIGRMFRLWFTSPTSAVTLSNSDQSRGPPVKMTLTKIGKQSASATELDLDQVTLVAPQPPPIIPYLLPYTANNNSNNNSNNNNNNNNNRIPIAIAGPDGNFHETHVIPHSCAKNSMEDQEAGIPLTAVYLKTGLVLSPNMSNVQQMHHSVPVLIAHQPSTTNNPAMLMNATVDTSTLQRLQVT